MQDYSGYGQSPSWGTMPMPPMPPRPPRRRIGLLSYLAVAVAAGALGAGSVVALYHPASNSSAAPQPKNSAAAPVNPLPSQPAPGSGGSSSNSSEQAIVSKIQPGLVIIDTTLQYNSEQAAATGMVISSDGLVLTNNHVIEGATSVKATDLGNGKTYTAKVLGYDLTGDMALIQLQNASRLHVVPIGDSSTVKTGDSVVAMGNAEGQNAIVPVTGQVTALNQTITAGDQGGTVTSETLHGMIETNANIVSGDSGGPLANSAGQVIGMDTAGSGQGFSAQQSTVGFAIPINTAWSVAQQISAGHGSSTITIGYPPFMGVYIPPASSDANPQDQAAQQQGGNGFGGNGFGGNGFGGNGGQGCVTSNRSVTTPATIAPVSSGTLIVGVICNGPAQAIGITAGSVITAVNGQAIGSPDSLTSTVSKYHPGNTISVTWVGPSGQRHTANMTLTAGPPQ